jgi:chromosome segregation ATPase
MNPADLKKAHDATERAERDLADYREQQREEERASETAKLRARAERAERERDELHRRIHRIESNTDIESDRMCPTDDRLIAALAENAALKARLDEWAKAERCEDGDYDGLGRIWALVPEGEE